MSTPTTAAVLRAVDAPLRLEDVELAAPGPGEVRVRLAGVGVCHTDLAAIDGAMPRPLPAVLGHEGAGVVEAVGDEVRGLAAGDAVVMSFDSCGRCPRCATGRPAYCEQFVARNYSGRRTDGSMSLSCAGTPISGNWLGSSAFARHALASERSAVKVRSSLPLELLGPLACGLQTGAGAVLNVLRPEPGDAICVFGLGAVGLAAVMAAHAAGCGEVIASDPVAARRALARELGVTVALDPTATDVVGEVAAAVPGGVACSVDAVGSAAVVAQALRVLRSPGTCATLGFRANRNPVTVDQAHLLFGRTLTGVVEGDADPQAFIPRLLALQAEGRFPFERLIETYPFADIETAIADLRRGAVVKPVLVV